MALPKSDGMEALASMPGEAKLCEDCCSHIPNRGEQMVSYYGCYNNVSRGKRKNQDQDKLIPSSLEPDKSLRKPLRTGQG